MGHELRYFDFKYEASTKYITESLQDCARRNSDAGGLYYGVQFKDITPFASRDEAYAYIQRVDKDYLNICVPYLDYPNIKVDESKLKELNDRYVALHQEYYARRDRQFYTTETVKSQYLGCKECGSRLAVKYLRGNRCPLCGAEMRPDTEMKRLDALKARFDKAGDDLAKARAKEEEKAKKGVKPTKMWLCKIEYHC